MGLFGSSGEKKPFDSDTFVLVFLLSLVIIQAVGLIIKNAFQFQIQLGPAFVLLGYIAAVWLAIGLARNMNKGLAIQRGEFLMFIVVFVAVVAAAILLPSYLPEIFQSGTRGIQSMIGIGLP